MTTTLPAPTTAQVWAGAWRIFAACAAIGTLLTLAGAFGTEEIPGPFRLAYWLVLLSSGGLIGLTSARLLLLIPWLRSRPAVAAVATGLVISVPMTAIVALSNVVMTDYRLSARDLAVLFPTVLGVSMVMTAIGFMVRGYAPRETHAAPEGAAPPKFLDRLPPKLRGAELHAVEAEDHYLRLHTSKGQDLILMRLSDAVAELEGLEGAQVHRSWWVARSAVVSAKRGDGRASLTLPDGSEAPVSRAYARSLREAGWF